jgi:hypothetical protein
MSYLYWLLGLEEEEKDDLKDRQKHLKYLCCKNIEEKNVPILRSKLSSFINEPQKKQKTKKNKNYKYF